MERIEMVALITDVPDRACEALEELKRLERAGWIDVTCYALLDKDGKGAVRIQETHDSRQATSAAGAEVAGVPGGWPFWLMGHASDAAQAWPAGDSQAFKDSLQPGHTALMVVLEERYAERVMEELETRGSTLRKPLRRSERVAALRASVEHARTNVNWLVDFLQRESAKAGRAEGREKEELEAAIAAGWAELGGAQENFRARLKALAAELEAELQETRDLLDWAEGDARTPLETRLGETETAITNCTHDLVLFLLDHMESVVSRVRELETKAAGAGAEAAKAIEEQSHELEIRMRKCRAELTATLGSSAARARRSLDRLRGEAASAAVEIRRPLENLMKKVDHRHASVKADLRRLEKEDIRAWHEPAAALRRSWCALYESVDRVKRRHNGPAALQ